MRDLTVLISFPAPKPTSNPYNSLLMNSLSAEPGVTVRPFLWRTALLGHYDLFHVHWPEILVNGHSPLKKVVRQVLFCLLMLRLRITRRPLVRTLHNLELPRDISKVEIALLRWAERWTTYWVVINESTPIRKDLPHSLALHGHYRDWYAQYPMSQPTAGKIGFFGRIRRYKNAAGLVSAFRQTTDPALTLGVAGVPSSDALTQELVAMAGADPRIHLDFGFLDDAALVRHVSSSELIVLPYPEMHNSGSAFAALSMDRPVLVPENEVNTDLAKEVGDGWVFCYEGELSGRHLEDTLVALRRLPSGSRPNLTRREWPLIARQHVEAYLAALRIAHGRDWS